jgi:hypothetical protein
MASDYTDSFAGEPYFIKKGEQLSAAGMTTALNTKEKVANKVTTIDDSSTDAQYPSAKAVHGIIQTINTAINTAINTDLAGVKTSLAGKQSNIPAGTASNIVAYSGMAGTVSSLSRVTTVRGKDTASDDNIPTEKAVATALETAVGGLQKMFPVGTILMHAGIGWVDNITLPGWYQCDGNNNTPNLKDKFIKGKGDLADTGGSNALTAAMLPKHTHTIYTNATKNTARTANKTLKGRFGLIDDGKGRIGDSGIFTYENWGGDSWDGDSGNRTIVNMDATHEHTGGANADNSSIDGATNTSNMPAYYSLIYIIRNT